MNELLFAETILCLPSAGAVDSVVVHGNLLSGAPPSLLPGASGVKVGRGVAAVEGFARFAPSILC